MCGDGGGGRALGGGGALCVRVMYRFVEYLGVLASLLWVLV